MPKTTVPLADVLHLASPSGWRIESQASLDAVSAYLSQATHPILSENPVRSESDIRERAIDEAKLLLWSLRRLQT